jgi:hypothetical protein
MSGTIASVAASVTNPAPVTPDAPFEVIMATARMPSSWPIVSGVLVLLSQKVAVSAPEESVFC